MRLQALVVNVLSAVLLIPSAQSAEQRSQLEVRPETRSTAREQLTLAHDLSDRIGDADTRDVHMMAVASAIAAAEVVAIEWPSDNAAVLDARLLQGEILRREKAWGAAKGVLLKALPVALRIDRAAVVHTALAITAASAGRSDEAKASAGNARRDGSMARLPSSIRTAVAMDLGRVYFDVGAYLDASTTLRDAAVNAPSPLIRAQCWVFAMRADTVRGAKVEASEAGARARAELLAARAGTLSSGDYALIESLERLLGVR